MADILVDTSWLAGHLDDPDVLVFDATAILRPDPGKGFVVESGKGRYDAGHIPGAGFLDLQGEFSDASSRLRFTVPDAAQFAEAAARHGISNHHHVVLYSTTPVMWATRMWFLFRAFGHDRVSVLDGGFAKWKNEGRSIEEVAVERPRGTYAAALNAARVADRDAVLRAIETPTACVLNSLSREQFVGEGGNYGRPGHIRNSRNVPWSELVDESGCFLPTAKLEAAMKASGALDADRVITYCGGGIAATVDFFVLALLGHEDKLAVYDNSLSEWAGDESLPMQVG